MFERENLTEGRFGGGALASRVERNKGLFSSDGIPWGCVPGGRAKMQRAGECELVDDAENSGINWCWKGRHGTS